MYTWRCESGIVPQHQRAKSFWPWLKKLLSLYMSLCSVKIIFGLLEPVERWDSAIDEFSPASRIAAFPVHIHGYHEGLMSPSNFFNSSNMSLTSLAGGAPKPIKKQSALIPTDGVQDFCRIRQLNGSCHKIGWFVINFAAGNKEQPISSSPVCLNL